jgi:uncharacterized protein DUF2478
MNQMVKRIAAIQGAPSAAVQEMFRALVERWRPTARIAGVIENGHGLADRTCCAGQLRSIVDGSCYPIFQDLGSGSTACNLDGSGAISACEAVRRDIIAGCDLVVISKFGKLEASREGLMAAFTAAIEVGAPVLTSVSPAFYGAWTRFAAPLFVALPAEPDKVEAWWRAVRKNPEHPRNPLPGQPVGIDQGLAR